MDVPESKNAELAVPAEPQADPVQEMKELLQRTQANFENYRKQMEKRMEELRQTAAKEIIMQLLPVIDNFELALKNAHTNTNDIVQGVQLIYSQLISMLEEQGVQPINVEHKLFDPYLHEPLLKVESDLPANTIIEELQKGYTLHGAVLRHTKVKLSAGRKNPIQENTKNKTDNQEV
ncbi:nucleotide exchange factor GrpE [Candidatus Woesearchaeota archaeon]|nr:nucleotide exchange factor GrpE [Candidatus Woesearchaeota archaeon]